MNLLSIANCIQLSSQLALVSDTPRLDVEIFLTHILQKNRTYLFTWSEKELTREQENQFNDFLKRRLTGEPVAHIIGQREFWSLPFAVNNSTLIPRPDTELLVEMGLELFSRDELTVARDLLDLGTGTGAIVLALAHEKKSWNCIGVDKEIAAVELAEKNRADLHISNAKIFQSNWFSALKPEQYFDVIISNPPYIDPVDPHLNQGDVRFEPRSALVAEKNGLADIEIICAEAPSFLKKQGWLLIEHGYDQGEAVRKLFLLNHFENVKTVRDIGGNERVTLGLQI